MSVNKAILLGNVGKDPEVRYLDGGLSVASFSLATTENYKNKAGEKVSQTEWHNIVAWRHLADLADKYINKGQKLYVEGKITNRIWEDKEGNKRYTNEIVASSIVLLGRRADDNASSSSSSSQPAQQDAAKADNPEIAEKDNADDDLPF
ncbi:MAG: single-stranded DNA-binding protein [Bacteroidales bacterium]|nr:single-stranded DNA-binding protein [Bacteroidales bacterium]